MIGLTNIFTGSYYCTVDSIKLHHFYQDFVLQLAINNRYVKNVKDIHLYQNP